MSFLWSFGAKKETVSPKPMAPTSPPLIKPMSHSFRKGVHYNMKIVLRGDVMTGKSNLFHRLQGAEFDANYISTPEIQVANIPWHYKDSNDIVKIEVWDVVDKAHNKKSSTSQGIKLEHDDQKTKEQQQQQQKQPQEEEEEEEGGMGLDAVTVNVYRNSHAAIFLFDITKPWTFDYVNKELENVPETISVLVLGNFCDKIKERKVDLDEIHATLYEHNQERIRKGAIKPNLIRYAEASMESGMGLKYIYDYLGVPFLQLMIESIKKQLELKAVEIVDLLEELDVNDDVPETMQRRRGQDNFSQPAEPRLARQQDELKSAWDKDLEDIAADHLPILDDSTSFERRETPPPPTAPVKIKKKEIDSLQQDPIPSSDQFEVGGNLEEDWFGEEESPEIKLSGFTTKKEESDDENFRGNPMVAGDEDVESVEYYSQKNIHQGVASDSDTDHNVIVQKIHSSDVEDDDQEEEEEEHTMHYQPPVFKSELNDVWSRSYRRPSGPEVVSESEDEDNVIHRVDDDIEEEEEVGGGGDVDAQMESPFSQGSSSHNRNEIASAFGMEATGSSSSASFGYGAYEEIGGGNGNPWSTEQLDQPWNIPKHDDNKVVMEQEVEHVAVEEQEQDNDEKPTVEDVALEQKKTEAKPKKKKSSKKKSSKKKSQ